ncbi:MAG: hypothetical protein ACR5LD_02060 [Symbiopectobacterium sp.]
MKAHCFCLITKYNLPVVLLMHGDGGPDRWFDGGYFPLVNALVAQDIVE